MVLEDGVKVVFSRELVRLVIVEGESEKGGRLDLLTAVGQDVVA